MPQASPDPQPVGLMNLTNTHLVGRPLDTGQMTQALLVYSSVNQNPSNHEGALLGSLRGFSQHLLQPKGGKGEPSGPATGTMEVKTKKPKKTKKHLPGWVVPKAY